MTRSDAILVQRAKKGDEDAFIEIYENNHPTIYTYVFYRVGDSHLAEDLTAEVFVRMIDKIHSFNPDSRPILAWLYTIAHNLVIDHYRKVGKASWTQLQENLVSEDSNKIAVIMEHRLNQEQLIKALNLLTETQRRVIIMKFIEGRSNAEVAQILNKSIGAVKSLQHRALDALKRTLTSKEHYEYAIQFE